ncbi:MAG: hypothetical protein ABI811_01270 [Acidobacteriota bacterium]
MRFAAILALLSAGSVAAQTCDRACLENMVDQYMGALIAHSPAKAPLAPRVKNTEDGVRLDPGDGFWRTAMGPGSYRLFNADVSTGQVVFFGTMREVPNLAVIVMIRLKVVNRQITEIENWVVRDAAAAKNLEDRGRPHESFLTAIPAAQRASRAALIQTANSYYAGLERNDGKGNYGALTNDCDRVQNGSQTTHTTPERLAPPPAAAAKGGKGPAAPPSPTRSAFDVAFNQRALAMGCLDQFKLGGWNYITRIRDRRFVVVDPERGVVTAIPAMDQASGKYRNFKLADGTDTSRGPEKPTTIAFAEMFKVEAGKIRRVEAVQINVPYGMITGWSTWEDGMSSKVQDIK